MVGGFFEVEKGCKTAGTSLFLVNVKFEKMKRFHLTSSKDFSGRGFYVEDLSQGDDQDDRRGNPTYRSSKCN